MNFLERSDVWRRGYNHNQLRITRILKCLILAGLEFEARAFHGKIINMLGDAQNEINGDAIIFWNEALGKNTEAS